MSDRELLLGRVKVCDFALTDAALYLDTHPDDEMALAYYRKHLAMRKSAAEAFTSKYGPLTHNDYDGGPRWKWVDEPWPWQNQEED